VSRGFTTEFAFRLFQDDAAAVASPCRVVDHAPEACTRRGGDGLALVLHTAGAAALGGAGAGLGYDGLPAGVALEFDTWADAAAADPGDNHIAVLTRGNATLRRVRTTLLPVFHTCAPRTRVLNCAVCVCMCVLACSDTAPSTGQRSALRWRCLTWATATATWCAVAHMNDMQCDARDSCV
jgi:hypothetical protein